MRHHAGRSRQIREPHPEEGGKDRQQDARKNKDIVLPGAPDPLQRRSYAVIEEHHDRYKEDIAGRRRDQDPGYQSPDLTVHDGVGIQRHIIQNLRIYIVDHISDQIEYNQLEGEIPHCVFFKLSLKIVHIHHLSFESVFFRHFIIALFKCKRVRPDNC